MKTMKIRIAFVSLVMAVGLLVSAACTSTGSKDGSPAKGGAELWAQNCRRCHNFRSPSGYSDSEWDVAMFHMRVRANLTGEEYEAIRQFLKASN